MERGFRELGIDVDDQRRAPPTRRSMFLRGSHRPLHAARNEPCLADAERRCRGEVASHDTSLIVSERGERGIQVNALAGLPFRLTVADLKGELAAPPRPLSPVVIDQAVQDAPLGTVLVRVI